MEPAYDKFSVTPKAPFDLGFGARFFASRSFRPLNNFEDSAPSASAQKSLVFHTQCNGVGVEIRVTQRKPLIGKLAVSWRKIPWVEEVVSDTSAETRAVSRADIRAVVKKVFSLDFDIEPFYKMVKTDRHLAKPFSQIRGFKPVLGLNVYDTALWAIVGQQVTFTFAMTLKHRLQERYGRALQTDVGQLPLTPTPERMLRVRVSALRKLQLSESKANYIHNISRAIVSGALDLEGLAQKPYDDAIAELVAIKGIGVWSANYILMRGAGHRDALPLGDAGLKRAVKTAYNLKESPTPEKIEQFAEPFRPYRSLYTLYLWQTLA